MKITSVALLAALALAITPAAHADEFAFSFSGNGITSSGTFTAVQSSTTGTYQVTGITGTFSDTNVGVSGNITGLYTPVSYGTTPEVNLATTAGAAGFTFSYDDTFYPGGDSPSVCADYPFFGGALDVYGIAFNVAGGYIGDIWSDGNTPPGVISDTGGLYYGAGVTDGATIYDNPNQGSGNIVAFEASPVPEPSTLSLLGLGVLGMISTRLRRR